MHFILKQFRKKIYYFQINYKIPLFNNQIKIKIKKNDNFIKFK